MELAEFAAVRPTFTMTYQIRFFWQHSGRCTHPIKKLGTHSGFTFEGTKHIHVAPGEDVQS